MTRQYDPAGGGFDRRAASTAAASHSHAATDVTSGTLSTDRYSAYADLGAESKIGTGAAQVAAGDHTHTTFGALSLTGALTLTGSGRVKREVYIPVSRLTLGASAPTATTRAVGASGSIKIPVLSFSKTVSQETYFEVHMPTDVDASVNVAFHLMWVPGAAWTTGTYIWGLDYLVKDETGAVNTGAPTPISMTVTPADAVTCIETVFTDTIDIGPEQMLWARLWRDVATDTADDVGEVRFCELEYVANVLGEAV